MLARFGSLPHQIEMGARRREYHDGRDRRIMEDRLGGVASRETIGLGKGIPPRGRGTEGGSDLNSLLEVQQAFGMRRSRHAEPDHADARLFHSVTPQPKFPRISIYTLHRCAARKSSYNFMKFVC